MLKKLYNKIIKGMYDWAMGIASKSNAVWALLVVSFVESSFFPIPPDIFLIPLVLAQREKAFRLALYCTIASVLGGFFGYAIGFLLDDAVLSPLLIKFHIQNLPYQTLICLHSFSIFLLLTLIILPTSNILT